MVAARASQLERLSDLVLEHEAGLTDRTWLGDGDCCRVSLVDGDVVLPQASVRLRGPVALAVV